MRSMGTIDILAQFLKRQPRLDAVLVANRRCVLLDQERAMLDRDACQAAFPFVFGALQFVGREQRLGLWHLYLRIGIAPLRVRQVMHRKQAIATENLPVHFDCQLLGVFEIFGNRRREVHVYAAFVAGDAQPQC